MIRCKVEGLSKVFDATLAETSLSSLASPDSIQLESFNSHRQSCSCLLAVPNVGVLRKLEQELVQKSIMGTNVTVVRINSREKRNRGDASMINRLAKAYHAYLLGDEELIKQARDRDKAGRIFHMFYANQNQVPNGKSGHVEAKVFARMRQLKLVRRKRYGEAVVCSFANLDGSFPTATELRSSREEFLEERKALESDKNGVSISPAAEEVVNVGETHNISITVTSLNPAISLVAVETRGPQRREFQLQKQRLPKKLNNSFSLRFSITPNRIGVFRANLHCKFMTGDKTSFTIAKNLKIRSGDKDLDAILKPEKPYERKKAKTYEKAPTQSFEPPRTEVSGGDNPFKMLPHSSVPVDVKDLIVNNEFENMLTSWPFDGVKGYAEYWNNLLWAKEHQEHLDIQLFDMESVQLEKDGRSYKLMVPGLAEGRPSVLKGDLVLVTWKRKLFKGRVLATKQLEVTLQFHERFRQRFNTSLDLVSVRFTFSRMTLRTSHQGVQQAESKMGEAMLVPSKPLLARVENASTTRDVPRRWKWANQNLNTEQTKAVENIVKGSSRPLPYIIFGPPGTGKSTTVIETVYQLALHESCSILLVAPSNDAADLLVKRLISFFPPSELRRLIAFSRSWDAVPPEIRRYASEGASAESQRQEILSARIVVATVNLAARFPYFGVPRGHFNVLVVDEAGHASEPEVVSVAASLIDFEGGPSKQVGQLVLAGDPQQLGPIITSDICRKFGMDVSYMERLSKLDVYNRHEGRYPKHLLTKLIQNYRSHSSILKLPNSMFYDGELQCKGDFMVTNSMASWKHLPKKGFPVFFHAVSGENLREGNSPSWFNPQEAQQVVHYVQLLKRETHPAVQEDDIGIVTPYQRHAQKIRLSLERKGIKDVKVGSVECFQGQERRVIILSTVRAETDLVSSDIRYNLGFVANPKRFNVAITRAKALLIVVGCPNVLAMDKECWLPFLTYCQDNSAWRGEEWKPGDVEASRGIQNSQQSWDLVGPSLTAEEGIAFIHREE